MDYKLKKKPKGVTIIEGFPSFGLVSTIAIEFLVDHIKDIELIGEFVYDQFPPTLAIHEGELLRPMSIWYSKKHNLLILHTTLNIQGHEWEMADTILKMSKELDAKEIISLEGVASPGEETEAYTFNNKKVEKAGATALNESILFGLTAALMLKSDKVTPLFAGAHSQLPDGQAASKIVEVLNEYIGLGIDSEPLLEKAKDFENKLKGMMQQAESAQKEAEQKRLSYLG